VVGVLGSRPVDAITTADVSELVTKLSKEGKKRETIRKSVKYLAAVLDECGIEPNPAAANRSGSARGARGDRPASWAEIARFVGQRKLSITADTYTHVMLDGREIVLAELVGAVTVPPPCPPRAQKTPISRGV
jgi:hypothetical protein